MATPLATLDRLRARTGEPIEADADIALANEMLEAASANVRHYGRNWLTPEEAPAVAITITVEAAARGFLNPAGLDTERGDAINFGRHESYTQGTALTPEEQRMLKFYSRRGGVISAGLATDVALVANHNGTEYDWRGYAYTYDGQKPFPLGVDPW